MCVHTPEYICISLVSIIASWCRFVLACFGGRAGCVKLGIFQGSTSLGCWTEDGHPMEDSLLCFHTSLLSQYALWEHKPKPEDPHRFWDLYPLWYLVHTYSLNESSVPLHSYITTWAYWGKEKGTEGELKRLLSIVLPTECWSLHEESQTNLCHVPVSLQLLETLMPLLCLLWYFCRGMNSKH